MRTAKLGTGDIQEHQDQEHQDHQEQEHQEYQDQEHHWHQPRRKEHFFWSSSDLFCIYEDS